MNTNDLDSSPRSGNLNSSTIPRLPACRFCHSRKSKCDNLRPKCSLCMKHGQECVTLSTDDDESFSREYISVLENDVKLLEEKMASTNQSHRTPGTSPGPMAESSNPSAPRQRSSSFIESGGISFMRHLFDDSEWREHDPTLLHNLSTGSGPAEARVKPVPLPSPPNARLIFDKYLNGSHVQNPFLLRRDVQDLYHRTFACSDVEDGTAPDSENIPKHDLFQSFMILAIGSILPYRNGELENHPYSYYLSALEFFDEGFLSNGLASIQDLLLVGRFAIYHHIGTSIWEITRLGMRMCIQQELHRAASSTSSKVGLLQEQLQRRVFWECYMIDRYSSITLDRPFAIGDKYIEIGFPADANDEEIEAAEASGAFPDLDSFASTSAMAAVLKPTTEMSVFFACLRLRQVTSQIHFEFRDRYVGNGAQNSTIARGVIYSSLDKLLSELQQWRASTPVFENPQNLYQMQEWYDLLCYRERLLLVRKAIDIVPKQGNVPPRDLLSLCLECACRAITIFSRLFERKKITFTRSYFQMLFTAGLSVMFCLSVVKDFDFLIIRNGADAMVIAEKALKRMGEELPDATRYVAVYEALRRYIIRKYSRQIQGDLHENAYPHIEASSNNLPETSAATSTLLMGSFNDRTHERESLHPSQNHSGGLELLGQQPHSLPPMHFPNTPFTPDPLSAVHADTTVSEGSIFSWDIFEDNALWNMEAGLNEYAYGDPPFTMHPNDSFDIQNMIL